MAALRKLKGLVGGDADPDPTRELWDLVEGAATPEWETSGTSCHHCKENAHQHNCRLCGFQFCGQCTAKYHLPEKFQKAGKKDESAQRVCYGCRDMFGAKDPKHSIPPLPTRIFVPVWELKAAATDCHKCHQKFKTGHQHNCRTCGKFFCSECTSKREVPPSFLKKGKTGPTRVCDLCRYAIVKGAILDENQAKARLAEEGKATDNSEIKVELPEVLRIPQYLAQFREYCSKNHAQENLNFLGAVEVFSDAVSTSQSALLPLANQIYHEFLVQTANQLVNLTSGEFEEIEAKMASGSVDSDLFGPACINVYTMVSKDVFRRFAQTPEAKSLSGASDAETLREYFANRHARLSFSIVQRLEDIELMKEIEMKMRQAPKFLRTIRQGLKSWSDAVEGSALVTYLCKSGYGKSRAEGLSVAIRLIEAGFLHHAMDPTLSFYDSESSSNIYQVPQQSDIKKFPAASSLLQNPQNVSGFFLLRGVRYNRLWGIASVKDMHIYFWRQDKQPHSALSLKGVNMVFETGGEIDEEEANDGFAFGVRSETEKKKEDAATMKSKLRHGQVYIRVLMPSSSEKAIAEATETDEYVFLLEDSSMRSRWRKCFESCGIPTKMMTHQGISKRASVTAQVAVRGVENERIEIISATAAVAERRQAPVTPKAPPPLGAPKPPDSDEDEPPVPPPKVTSKPPPPPIDVSALPELQHAMQNKERQAALALVEGRDSESVTSPSSPSSSSSFAPNSPSSSSFAPNSPLSPTSPAAKSAIPVRPSKKSPKPGGLTRSSSSSTISGMARSTSWLGNRGS